MIEKVIEHFGGTTKTAKVLGVEPAAVSQWIAKKEIPPKRAIEVERITDGLFKAVDLIGDWNE